MIAENDRWSQNKGISSFCLERLPDKNEANNDLKVFVRFKLDVRHKLKIFQLVYTGIKCCKSYLSFF